MINMSKFIYSTMILAAGMLMNCCTTLQAQDSALIKSARYKDSLLNIDLLRAEREVYYQLLMNKQSYEINHDAGNVAYNMGYPVNVELSNQGIRFVCTENRVFEVRFIALMDNKFKLFTTTSNIQGGMSVTEYKLKLGTTIISVKNERQLMLKSIANSFIKVQKLLNDLIFGMNVFEQTVAEYKTSPVRPAMIEEQRKYIIQAESHAKLYQYDKAIELSYKAAALHPVAYPSIYMNLAILLAETNRLHSAIYNMKKYLMLSPSPEDEKFARSRINEWEIILNN